VGCAPSIYFNEEYNDCKFNERPLKIAFVDSLKIQYEGSMDNEFPSDNREARIRKYIGQTMTKALQDSSLFSQIKVTQPYCDTYQKSTLHWRDTDTFKVLLPSTECTPPDDSNALWLFIQEPKVVSKPWVQIIMVYMVPVGAIPHKPLTLSSRFVYWDAVMKKPVAWGFANGTYDDGPSVTIKNWDEASKRFALSMIRKSPLVKKSFISSED
jgi:hypothetical protein